MIYLVHSVLGKEPRMLSPRQVVLKLILFAVIKKCKLAKCNLDLKQKKLRYPY
jgi:hypothetical protein